MRQLLVVLIASVLGACTSDVPEPEVNPSWDSGGRKVDSFQQERQEATDESTRAVMPTNPAPKTNQNPGF